MNIIVTGGAGFIGSNFIRRTLAQCEDTIVNIDALTYSGNIENLKGLEKNKHYHFVKGDICNRELMDYLFMQFHIDCVVNFAAESHVDRSIETPDIFLQTNVLGTNVLLDAARDSWAIGRKNKFGRSYRNDVKFLQVSTDEVYGELGATGLFTETMPLSPNSPYSVSKASADMLVLAYARTYGIPVNITRCSNNYGPYQFPEKLIPLMINNCRQGKRLPVYGDGMQIRDWLHVADHCAAIDVVLRRGIPGEVYNIGGNNERTNIEIVKTIIKQMGQSDEMIQYVTDRPGHDRRYAIDNTKITSQLGWSPSYTFDAGIHETILWYQENADWLERIVSGAYAHYYDSMYRDYEVPR